MVLCHGSTRKLTLTHLVWLHLYKIPRTGKSTEREAVTAQGHGRDSGEWLLHQSSLWVWWECFKCGGGCTTLKKLHVTYVRQRHAEVQYKLKTAFCFNREYRFSFFTFYNYWNKVSGWKQFFELRLNLYNVNAGPGLSSVSLSPRWPCPLSKGIHCTERFGQLILQGSNYWTHRLQ